MTDQIERKIKGRDAVNDAARNTERVSRLAAPVRRRINRDNLADKSFGFARRPIKRGDSAFDFAQRCLQGFRRFGGNRFGKFAFSPLDSVGA